MISVAGARLETFMTDQEIIDAALKDRYHFVTILSHLHLLRIVRKVLYGTGRQAVEAGLETKLSLRFASNSYQKCQERLSQNSKRCVHHLIIIHTVTNLHAASTLRAQFMDKRLFIQVQGGRKVSGILRGYDIFLNIVLDEATEETNPAQKNQIGQVVSAHDHVGVRAR